MNPVEHEYTNATTVEIINRNNFKLEKYRSGMMQTVLILEQLDPGRQSTTFGNIKILQER